MRNRLLFILSGAGVALALVSAVIFGQHPLRQPPLFNPAANPYADGIFANGIIESRQAQGQGVAIFPEVSGPVTQILVTEGMAVQKGAPMLVIDDSVQRGIAEQQQAQAEAAQAQLQELKAQPRPEILKVAEAQLANAEALLKSSADQLSKQEEAFRLDPKSISRDALDNARNAERIAASNLDVARKQWELVRAGAWIYDIQSQERQAVALTRAAASSAAQLAKFTLRAPVDGTVLAVQATLGSTLSPSGAYDSHTETNVPPLLLGAADNQLQVRAYIDEILIHRLADASHLQGQMYIRGTDLHVPLHFVRVQPLVSPKIEISDQRQERVDVRVLPVIFNFDSPPGVRLFPGQLVDVYVSAE